MVAGKQRRLSHPLLSAPRPDAPHDRPPEFPAANPCWGDSRMSVRPREAGSAFIVQIVLVGVLLPMAFFFLLQAEKSGGVLNLAAGVLGLLTASAAGWSIWKQP